MSATNTELVSDNALFDLMESDQTLQAAFESMTRTIESADALFLLNRVPDVSFESSARAVLQALSAGSTVDLSDIVYSKESFSATAKTVVKNIAKAILEFVQAMLDYLSNLDIAAIWLGRKISMLEKSVATTRGMHPGEATIKMGRQARYLRAGGKYIREAARLETELNYMDKVIGAISTVYTKQLLDAANALPGAARGKTGDALAAAMVDLIGDISFTTVANKCDMQAAPHERFNRSGVMATKPLLGGHSVFFLQADLKAKGVSGFSYHGMLYESTFSQEPKIDGHVDMDTLAPGQIGKIPEALSNILKSLSHASNLPVRTQINHAKGSLNNFVNSMEGTEQDVVVLRKTVSALTYWMGNPSRQLYSNAMSVVRAALTYCNDSISTYK